MTKRPKDGFVKAEDVVDLVASPEMQKTFAKKGICKASISKSTAIRWLKHLDWRYQTAQNGMYIDGHERECYALCCVQLIDLSCIQRRCSVSESSCRSAT